MRKGEKVKFLCRAAGVVFQDGRVLLEKVETLDFWTLPGGQVELGETSEDALRREMLEEAKVEVTISGFSGWLRPSTASKVPPATRSPSTT